MFVRKRLHKPALLLHVIQNWAMTSFPAQVLIPAGFPQLQLLRFELETDQQSSVTLRSMRDVWTYLHNETKKVSHIISGCFLTARASWALQVRLEFRCVKAKLKIWADFSFLANLISLSFFFVAFCYQTTRAKCKWLTERKVFQRSSEVTSCRLSLLYLDAPSLNSLSDDSPTLAWSFISLYWHSTLF